MKKHLFLLGFLLVTAEVMASNENPTVGARAAALGNASVCLGDGWSAAQNQAGLGFVHAPAAGIYSENRFLLKELSLRSGVVAIPLKAGTIGLSLSNFGYSLYKENKYSLAFAKAFSRNFSAGMAIDYLHTRIAEENGNFSAVVGEIGIQAKPYKNMVVGAHLYNPTRSKAARNSQEHLPTILRFGLGYSLSSQVFLTVETEKDLAEKAIFKAGIEYQPLNHFYLRIGTGSEPVLTTFGFGLHLNNFQLDVSANYHQTLGITPQLGLSYLVNKSNKTVRDDR